MKEVPSSCSSLQNFFTGGQWQYPMVGIVANVECQVSISPTRKGFQRVADPLAGVRGQRPRR